MKTHPTHFHPARRAANLRRIAREADPLLKRYELLSAEYMPGDGRLMDAASIDQAEDLPITHDHGIGPWS